MRSAIPAILAAAVVAIPLQVAAQGPPSSGDAAANATGATAYTKYCASCHDQVGARIPTRDALAEMSPARILRTLDFGLMMSIAYPMKRDEREAVAAFLGKGATTRRRRRVRCAAPTIGS